jgi:hypothetical protein
MLCIRKKTFYYRYNFVYYFEIFVFEQFFQMFTIMILKILTLSKLVKRKKSFVRAKSLQQPNFCFGATQRFFFIFLKILKIDVKH